MGPEAPFLLSTRPSDSRDPLGMRTSSYPSALGTLTRSTQSCLGKRDGDVHRQIESVSTEFRVGLDFNIDKQPAMVAFNHKSCAVDDSSRDDDGGGRATRLRSSTPAARTRVRNETATSTRPAAVLKTELTELRRPLCARFKKL